MDVSSRWGMSLGSSVGYGALWGSRPYENLTYPKPKLKWTGSLGGNPSLGGGLPAQGARLCQVAPQRLPL